MTQFRAYNIGRGRFCCLYRKMFSSTSVQSNDSSLASSVSMEEVAKHRYPLLVQELKIHLPDSLNVLSMLTAELKYDYFGCLGAKVYTPKNPQLWGGLVVIRPVATSAALESMAIFWKPDHFSEADVSAALSTLPGLSWQRPLMVRTVPRTLADTLDRALLHASGGVLRPGAPNEGHVIMLEGRPELDAGLPEGFFVKVIPPSYAAEVLSFFVGRYTESQEGFSRCFSKLPSAGVFRTLSKDAVLECSDSYTELKTDNLEKSRRTSDTTGKKADESPIASLKSELACFVALKHCGDVGMLYTKEQYRRMGLAKAAVLHLVNRLNEDNQICYAFIDFDNDVSEQMCITAGFRKYINSNIAFYYPPCVSFKDIILNASSIIPEDIKKYT